MYNLLYILFVILFKKYYYQASLENVATTFAMSKKQGSGISTTMLTCTEWIYHTCDLKGRTLATFSFT